MDRVQILPDGNDEIYRIAATGGEAVNLTRHAAADFQPHVHPEGDRLVFASDRSGSSGLYSLDIENGRVEVVLDGSANESAPQWSPEGDALVFVSDEGATDDIYLLGGESTPRLLASTEKADWSPRWAPDGRSVAFISGDFGTDVWSLYVVRLPDGAPELVVEGVDSGNPAWGAQGERLYFGRYIDGESRLFTIELATGRIDPVGREP
ncbi:MAG: hypothetical protein AAF389_11995 [Gemmatimonadota bacterium]